MMGVFEDRRKKTAAFLESEGVDLLLLEDCEGRRNPSIRYLTGHPGDALLFLTRTGEAVLMPWDVHLAERRADAAVGIFPYNDFGRRPVRALRGFLEKSGRSPAAPGPVVETGAGTPHLLFEAFRLELTEAFPNAALFCREDGADAFLTGLRKTKDDEEIQALRKAAAVINQILAGLESDVRKGKIKTETDVALFIERESRILGAEGTSFPTLAAGPSRSFGIHAFPNFGSGPFGTPGLSILDFGVTFDGYAGDVTITLAAGRLSAEQKKHLDLVQEAYDLAEGLVRPGVSARSVAAAVEELFSRHGLLMPHALGHGLGLEVHEAPFLRNRDDAEAELEAGMVLTLEPGLYHPGVGGVRLENDLLLTPSGKEVLTSARILFLP